MQLPWQNEPVIYHTQRLLSSFHSWTGNFLLDTNRSALKVAEALFQAPFVLASHGTEPDPIFNYGNRKALELWELSWEELTKMPSRKAAEQVEQAERDRLLQETTIRGFSHFSGIRISSTGKRFFIEDGILWNVIDEQKQYCGQATVFSKINFLPDLKV